MKMLKSLLKYMLLIFLIIMTSCGNRSAEDFREEGQGIIRSLVKELQKIHTREQLIAASNQIQQHFDRLVVVIIAAEEYNLRYLNQEKLLNTPENRELSDQLRVELNRLYRIEGCRSIIEKSQKNALHKLDAYEKTL